MRLNLNFLHRISPYLDVQDLSELTLLARKADQVEARWRGKLEGVWKGMTLQAIESLETHGRVTSATADDIERQLEAFFMEQMLQTTLEAFKSARRRPTVPRVPRAQLKAPPKQRLPQSLSELRKLWDAWRKKGEVPLRQRELALRVKKAYIAKCQDNWQKYSEAYRRGDTGTKFEIVERMKKVADTERSRAENIVDTESTRYWNQTRRSVYDEADDVIGYLFVPIRDYATTKWCKSRQGLVYRKGTKLLERETPPIHWRCRSEILPLTYHNPKHRKLLENPVFARENHQCEPLPPGWNR